HLCSVLCLYRLILLPDLSSFPTLRSSDLQGIGEHRSLDPRIMRQRWRWRSFVQDLLAEQSPDWLTIIGRRSRPIRIGTEQHEPRSEEHTSELQSHLNLVCRLLLEKKNTQP